MKDVSCWCKGLAEKFSFCSVVHIETVREIVVMISRHLSVRTELQQFSLAQTTQFASQSALAANHNHLRCV